MAQDVYVRLPAGLHSELRRRAQEQGVSLNQLCVALLAGGVGFKLEKPDDSLVPPVLESIGQGEEADAQISYRRAVEHLAEGLDYEGVTTSDYGATRLAEHLLRPALSDKGS